jgi:hypothetical protein
MTTSQNYCSSYLLELHQAIHDWRTDQMKLALYTASASLDPTLVTAYTATNEVSGSGYTAGGFALTVSPGYPKLSPTGAPLVLIDVADIAASASGFSYRYGLVHNATKASRAVAILDFAAILAVTTSLGVVWPVPDDNSCIFRLGA